MSIAPEDVQPTFDSNARKFRCCCGCGWHIRVCAKIIGSMESVCITIAFVSALVGYIHYRSTGNVPKQPPRLAHPLKTEFGHDLQQKWNESRGNESEAPMSVIQSNPDVLFAIHAFFFALVWIAVVLMFYGINHIRPKCLLPHLFLQALCALYTLVMAVVYGLQKGKWAELTFPARPASIIYSLGLILEIYFFISVARCYCYLKAKRRASPSSRLEKQEPLEVVAGGSPT